MSRQPIHGLDLSTVEWKDVAELYGGEGQEFVVAPGEQVCVLSEDPVTGASTVLIRLPPGWASDAPEVHSCAQEELLLEGDLTHAGVELKPFSYVCFPAGEVHGPLSTRGGCVVLAWMDGPVDVEYRRG